MALRTIATAATILCVMLPVSAHGQSAAKTACNDGTTTTATGPNACDSHGGIHRLHTTIVRRAPSRTETQEPARVAQAGTPASSRDARSEPAEHRGWRWSHHDDRDDARRRAEEKRREEERRRLEAERREKERHRVRCRDGRYEELKEHHGKGKGPDVCKHHGGIAH